MSPASKFVVGTVNGKDIRDGDPRKGCVGRETHVSILGRWSDEGSAENNSQDSIICIEFRWYIQIPIIYLADLAENGIPIDIRRLLHVQNEFKASVFGFEPKKSNMQLGLNLYI